MKKMKRICYKEDMIHAKMRRKTTEVHMSYGFLLLDDRRLFGYVDTIQEFPDVFVSYTANALY
jgi:hypothetical protein